MKGSTVAALGVGVVGFLGIGGGALYVLTRKPVATAPQGATQPYAPAYAYGGLPYPTQPYAPAPAGQQRQSVGNNLADLGTRFVAGIGDKIAGRAIDVVGNQVDAGLDQFFGSEGSNFGAGTFGF